MVRRKRPYVPKIKGCYECSQRRINCDGTQPSCQKCAVKGIPCTGFGVVYRFRQGLSQKPQAPRKSRNGSNLTVFIDPCSGLGPNLADDVPIIPSNIEVEDAVPSQAEPTRSAHNVDVLLNWESISELIANLDDDDLHNNTKTFTEDLGKPQYHDERESNAQNQISCINYSPIPGPILLEPWQEFLLTYFSNHIAPEMVVLDDCHNGWRNLILPMAWTDELIMNSVLSASAFHLTTKNGGQTVANAQQVYGQAICELQRRRNLVDCDYQTKQAVILSIMILLVSVMVNGCCDFPIMFGMLESALDAVGGEGGFLNGEVGEFFVRQIRKMRVYAAPLLSQDAGLHAMMHHAHTSFDCLRFYGKLHPAQSAKLKLLGDLRQQAYEIYLDRVLSNGSRTLSRKMIDHFATAVQSVSVGSLGSHVLVWPVFIVASESCKKEHQAIFEEFLQQQYKRNGFVNILRALDFLKKIWARESNTDWPALLPEPQVFVM